MKKLFGGKPGEPAKPAANSANASASKTINTIQGLTDQEEALEKRKTLLEKRIEAELEKAREFTKQKKKPQALQCLKKKKLLEQEMSNLDNMIMRVIEQRTMLEGQRTTVEVVSTMHQAAMTAKENMKAMKIENVDKVRSYMGQGFCMTRHHDLVASHLWAHACTMFPPALLISRHSYLVC